MCNSNPYQDIDYHPPPRPLPHAPSQQVPARPLPEAPTAFPSQICVNGITLCVPLWWFLSISLRKSNSPCNRDSKRDKDNIWDQMMIYSLNRYEALSSVGPKVRRQSCPQQLHRAVKAAAGTHAESRGWDGPHGGHGRIQGALRLDFELVSGTPLCIFTRLDSQLKMICLSVRAVS